MSHVLLSSERQYRCRYLNKVDDAVKAAKQATDGPITVLAHSAGGWLSRVYLLVSRLQPFHAFPTEHFTLWWS